MTLVAFYKDTLVSDRMVALGDPHSYVQTTREKKLFVSTELDFAFAVAGPTFSLMEQCILAASISEGFKEVGYEANKVHLPHINTKDMAEANPSMILITKKSIYILQISDKPARSARRISRTKPADIAGGYALIKMTNRYPIVYGTGMHIAAIAFQEGVLPKDVTEFTSQIEYTVSAECDYISQKDLKAWKL